jgi:hypothetical protein
MFYCAHLYILVLGMMLASSWSTFLIHLEGMGRPIEHMARNMGISAGVYCVVVGLPYFFLWRSYKRALPSFASTQDEVVVERGRQQEWRLVVAMLCLALVLMGVALVFLVRTK